MSLPAIRYYDDQSPQVLKTVTFTQDCFRLQIDSPRNVLRNLSAAGQVETLGIRADVLVSIGFRSFVNSNSSDATLKRNLQQFYQIAMSGGTWYFARDGSNLVLTTLSANEIAGQTVISLTSTTGIVAGRQYVIRSETSVEVVKVLSVDSGVQVTLVEGLNFEYASGSRFRAEQYWPARLDSNENILIERPPLWYDVDLKFVEDVNTL